MFFKGKIDMRLFKEMKWESILRGVLYVVLGLVALIVPQAMEKTLGYMIGIVLILAGAVSMIGYLLRDAYQNYYHDDFVYGLIVIAIGVVVLYKIEVVIAMIPFILGILILASGCVKLQDAIDMKRLSYGNWIVMLALALINIVIGIVLMYNPFKAALLMFRVLGVCLILSGGSDIIVKVYFAVKFTKYKKNLEVEASQVEEIPKEETEAENWDEK